MFFPCTGVRSRHQSYHLFILDFRLWEQMCCWNFKAVSLQPWLIAVCVWVPNPGALSFLPSLLRTSHWTEQMREVQADLSTNTDRSTAGAPQPWFHRLLKVCCCCWRVTLSQSALFLAACGRWYVARSSRSSRSAAAKSKFNYNKNSTKRRRRCDTAARCVSSLKSGGVVSLKH